MLKLFYSPGACSMAPHIVLEEIGKPYEAEVISIPDGKTQSPEWKAVNPKGRVPALLGVPGSMGGKPGLLTEANAIMLYLARTNPGAKLLPSDPAAEARCIEWMNWLTGTVHATAIGQVWRTARFADDEKAHPAIKAKGEQSVKDAFAYIESVLGDGRDWAVPGQYTVVDPYLFVFYRWGGRLGLNMSAQYPAWTRIMDKVKARPAVQKVLADEKLEIK